MRLALIGVTIVLFARTTIFLKVWRTHRFMPLLLGFLLVALFIWFAENVGTYTGTWLYPRQMAHWTLVPVSKLTSLFMLMIISYSLVAWINGVRALDPAALPLPLQENVPAKPADEGCLREVPEARTIAPRPAATPHPPFGLGEKGSRLGS